MVDLDRSIPEDAGMGMGLAIGISVGMIFGTAIDNLALGFALGAAIGVALGPRSSVPATRSETTQQSISERFTERVEFPVLGSGEEGVSYDRQIGEPRVPLVELPVERSIRRIACLDDSTGLPDE